MISRKLFLGSVSAAFVFFGVVPVLYSIFVSITDSNGFTFEAYKSVFMSATVWKLLLRSFLLAGTVASISVIIGTPIGILLGKTDIPLKKSWMFLLLVPLFVPPYIWAISWSQLFAASNQIFWGFWGVVLVLSSVFVPIPAIVSVFATNNIPPQLEEAALLTTGWFKVLFSITLPIILPSVVVSGLIVFVLTFGEMSVPLFLRYNVFPVEVYTQFSAFYDFKTATATAVFMLAITLIIFSIAIRFLSNNKNIHLSLGWKTTTQISTGNFKTLLVIVMASFVFIGVVLPLIGIIKPITSWQWIAKAWSVGATSLARSLIYSVAAATIITFIGFVFAYAVRFENGKIWGAIENTSLILFILPATVNGVSLILFWNHKWSNFVYSTATIVILGYVVKYTALADKTLLAHFVRMPTSLDEAASVAGIGWLKRMIFIKIPVASHGIALAWLISLVFALRDSEMAMMLYPPGHETLPIKIFTLMANGAPQLIASLCLIMILCSVLAGGLLWFWAIKSKGF